VQKSRKESQFNKNSVEIKFSTGLNNKREKGIFAVSIILQQLAGSIFRWAIQRWPYSCSVIV